MSTIGRVTHFTVRASTLGNLQTNLQKMSDLQAQMSSGTKITVASDDPAGTADVLRIQGDQRLLDQYSRNAADGEAWLLTVDSALTTSLSSLRKARNLTVQGGSGALGTTSRAALAQEIEGIRESLLAQANTTYLGRSVFAGTVSGEAFSDAAGGYTFNGVATARVERTVASDTTVRVDSTGSAVFGEGTDSVFAVLDRITAALNDTTTDFDPSAFLDEIDGHLDNMLTELSSNGARQNQVDSAQDLISANQITAKTRLGAIQDVDLAQIILDIQSQEVAYQGALGAAAKVLQPTLLDFLR
ncbi:MULTISPECIES: flagellar hook-associated protein FlgL [unclassified Cellulomonas]|uniref:flagellar hook-associated protein FlgL n=1 Tax=unclassified Cellulomonas TaxID=2620175 RepID=UPI001998FCC4|nr:flagellar hook-associated protein FlgL [Cellulomonas sp. ES6]MBD3778842.1 flagellar hook-associated protein FlgL [Micrococcales bacterium]WHP19045.1 flagellar hook-associated protein FlgL [Cellulomonas sp. ES6]